jgi:hypothetical protein
MDTMCTTVARGAGKSQYSMVYIVSIVPVVILLSPCFELPYIEC